MFIADTSPSRYFAQYGPVHLKTLNSVDFLFIFKSCLLLEGVGGDCISPGCIALEVDKV